MFQTNKGVGVVNATETGTATDGIAPKTILNAMEVKFVAVEYVDTGARRQSDIFLELDGVYYAPPNSAAWAATLKPVVPWLQQGIAKKLPRGTVQVSDAVEVIPE